MGSQIDERNELTVLVTGFGPFRDEYPVNPSWEIARSLPEYLPPLRAKDPSTRNNGVVDLPEVRILVPPEPIRVNYKVVRDMVPSFWDTEGSKRVDMAIHIGMAGIRQVYCIERRGHRDGYKNPDVDGEKVDDEHSGDGWIWDGLPQELVTDYDMEDVFQRWRAYTPGDTNLRISEDAGRFLCDFIYYSSLAHLYKEGRPRKVTFLHVPADASPESVKRGREAALNLIRSIVESEVAKDKLADI